MLVITSVVGQLNLSVGFFTSLIYFVARILCFELSVTTMIVNI